MRNGILQRKCVCDASFGRGKCAECNGKPFSLRRRTPYQGGHAASPSIGHEAFRSPGRPLSSAERSVVEPRFGLDFSTVRIHDDHASHMAGGKLNARAFTIGQHVYFGSGEYRPESADSTRLLTHELAHTIQQRNASMAVPPSFHETLAEDHHGEREAEHAAQEVVAGRFVRVTGSGRMVGVQRDDKSTQAQAPKIVAPVEPSKTQKNMIDTARRAAAIRTQVAMFKASGVQGTTQFLEARRLAQIKFDWASPNMDQISEVLSGMGGGLVTVDVKVAGAGDPECEARAGYVRGHRPPIVLCPGFFKNPGDAEGRIRTMVHEMAHVKGIGNANVGEQYFPVFDCTSKGAFESADSWANYVHCLSGQTPDKPEEIVVPAGGSQGGKQSPKKPGEAK